MTVPRIACLVLLACLLPLHPAAAGGGSEHQAVIDAAIAISQQRFQDGSPAVATSAILSRTGVFADSLSGSSLTFTGPMLFTDPEELDAGTLAEVQRLLGDGDRVYLLGGEAALSAAVEQAVVDAGFTPFRLAGASRVETSLAIAGHARDIGGTGRLVLARADGPAGNPTAAWADSVTAGAWAANEAVGVVLNPSDQLHPAVATRLEENKPQVFLMGGEAALSAAVQAEVAARVPEVIRVSGANRYATAVAIADQLWGDAASGTYLVTSGDATDGWAYGLAGAGLGAALDAPLLLVETNRLPAETDARLCATGTRADVQVLGGPDVVSDEVRAAMATPC